MVSSIAEISLAEAHVDLQIIGNIKSFSQSEQLLAHLLVLTKLSKTRSRLREVQVTIS